MTIRLIALWLLVLTGLAGTPGVGWTAAEARAAKAQDVAASPAAPPRAERAGGVGLEPARSIFRSDETGGSGDGSAAAPALAENTIRPPARESAIPVPYRAASGLSAGHAFSARAPPSV